MFSILSFGGQIIGDFSANCIPLEHDTADVNSAVMISELVATIRDEIFSKS